MVSQIPSYRPPPQVAGITPRAIDGPRCQPAGPLPTAIRLLPLLVLLLTVLPTPVAGQGSLRSVGQPAVPTGDREGDSLPVEALPLSWTGSLTAESILDRSFLGPIAVIGAGAHGTVLSHAGADGEAHLLAGPVLRAEVRARAFSRPQWVTHVGVGMNWSLSGSSDPLHQPVGATLTTGIGLAPRSAESPVAIERIDGGPVVRAGVPVDFRAVLRGPEAGRAQIQWEFGSGGMASGRTVTHRFREHGPVVVTCTAATPRGMDVGVHRVTVLADW